MDAIANAVEERARAAKEARQRSEDWLERALRRGASLAHKAVGPKVGAESPGVVGDKVVRLANIFRRGTARGATGWSPADFAQLSPIGADDWPG